MNEINLTNLGGGAVSEKFQDELEKIIKNIIDPNTEAKAKREISLKIIFLPDNSRSWVGVKIEALSKLAPNIAYATRAFVGVDKKSGRTVACEDNPNQITIDDFMEQNNVEKLPEQEEKQAVGE